mmetsp:Transcript_47321/g.131585  ORF Transcript_47321/g.131585 Transcript_47321/m.131585 type:complete len:240 (+) Transcript_47321:248-967(+)
MPEEADPPRGDDGRDDARRRRQRQLQEERDRIERRPVGAADGRVVAVEARAGALLVARAVAVALGARVGGRLEAAAALRDDWHGEGQSGTEQGAVGEDEPLDRPAVVDVRREELLHQVAHLVLAVRVERDRGEELAQGERAQRRGDGERLEAVGQLDAVREDGAARIDGRADVVRPRAIVRRGEAVGELRRRQPREVAAAGALLGPEVGVGEVLVQPRRAGHLVVQRHADAVRREVGEL